MIVFHHIHKTAGTSFRQFVRSSLSDCEPVMLGGRKIYGRRNAHLKFFRSFYKRLEPERRERLRCVQGHIAGFLLPALDRPAQGLTIIRDPVERVLSHYYFGLRSSSRAERPEATIPPLGVQIADWAGRDPPKGQDAVPAISNLFNWQSRMLLMPWYDVSSLPYTTEPTVDADVWRERLFEIVDRRFLVGTQEDYEGFVNEVCARFGWEPILHRLKVNRERPEMSEAEDELRNVVAACNWLDIELYERYSSVKPSSTSRQGSESVAQGARLVRDLPAGMDTRDA